jgi:hypothetical protein
MVEPVDSLSLVLWGVFFIAAGIYPLGLMLGAPCSPCCGAECLSLFYRCRRQVSVNGSVPPTPSETIYTLEDAYIYTASNESTLKVSLELNEAATHWRLRGNESVTYETVLTHYATGFVLASQQAPCQSVKPRVRVTVQGVTVPIEFADTVLAGVSSGGVVSRSANIIAGEHLGGGNQYNAGATITTTVVAATVSGSTGKIDGSIVTEPFLRGLLTATTSAPSLSSTTCVVTMSGNLSAFGYMNSGERCELSWLVRVVRDSVPHDFVVTVEVRGRINFTPLPDGGLTAVSVPPLPAPARGIREPYTPPVVTRSGEDYAITARPRRDASGNRITNTENLALSFSLEGRCRLGLWRRRAFGNVGGANQTILAQWSAPIVLPESTGTAGSFSFGNRAADSRQPDAHLPDYSSDTIAFLPPWDTAVVAGTYDVAQVEGYRDDGAALPATGGTGLFSVSLAEPSPMCGMKVCSLPQSLLPAGVTYTPAASTMWGCRPARGMVLGNSASDPCRYSHVTTECLSNGSASVSLFDLFTAWSTTLAIKQAKLDALTWLDYDVSAASFVSGGATYVFGGTYDPTFERPGNCYVGTRARSATVGGVCFPSEVTVTVGSFSAPTQIPVDREIFGPSLDGVEGMAGDYVLGVYFLTNFPSLHDCGKNSYLGGIDGGFTKSASLEWYVDRKCDGTETQLGSVVLIHRHIQEGTVSPAVVTVSWRSGSSGTLQANGFSRRYAEPLSLGVGKTNGGLAPQCSGVSFTPTAITVPLTRQPSFTYGRADRPNDVVATGPWLPCGYGGRLWNWLKGDSQSGGENNGDGGLPSSLNVVLPENDDSEPVTHTVTLTSEGSTPTDIAVTVPGRCGTIVTSATEFIKQPGAANTWRQIAPVNARCVTIPVVVGRTCSWTAVASGDIAIEDGTATGTGSGQVNAIRNADGKLSGTITISLDNPIPAGSWRYSYSPLIIQIG